MSGNAAKLLNDQKTFLPADSPVPNRRILIVDDEVEIGNGIKQILCPEKSNVKASARSSRSQHLVAHLSKESGVEEFDVVAVTTPERALEAINAALKENKPFAMGFFDVVLNNPELDGIELVKRAFAIDNRIFAVFVTAYQDRSVDAIGSLLGEENRERWDYINKPFTASEILQKARNTTSLWDLHRLKGWQEERLSELNQLLLQHERYNTAAAVGRSVAHEFGNLFTHIVGNAEIALQKDEPQSMKNALNVILKATDTASSVLQRLRRLNDFKDKKMRSRAIDAWQALQEALELVDFQLRKQFIRVAKPKPRVRSFMIHGNRHSLVQVFVNIFINSMHAMPNGGDLLIVAQDLEEMLEISVRDTGPGVPEEILSRLTEPLFTTKGSAGSGLGLSICKEIVEFEHSGELVIRNHARGGLEVLVQIPLPDIDESNEEES